MGAEVGLALMATGVEAVTGELAGVSVDNAVPSEAATAGATRDA